MEYSIDARTTPETELLVWLLRIAHGSVMFTAHRSKKAVVDDVLVLRIR